MKMSNAQIAQLVEQRTENPRVAGSIPALGIFYYKKGSVQTNLFCIYRTKRNGKV